MLLASSLSSQAVNLHSNRQYTLLVCRDLLSTSLYIMEEDDRLQQEEELLALQAIYGESCVLNAASCEAR